MRPVGASLIQADRTDRRTDMAKLGVIHDYAKAPKSVHILSMKAKGGVEI